MTAAFTGIAAIVRSPLIALARAILRRPHLRKMAMRTLDRFPAVRVQLRRAMRGADWQTPRRAHLPRNRDDLSPATRAAYDALDAAFARRQRP